MSGHLTGGIETFLLSMNRHMSKDCVFDYVFMEENTIHQAAIEANGGKAICITPIRKNPLKNVTDLIKVLRQNRKDHPVAYFNLFSMVHMVPVLLAKMMGYRIVLHAHNSNLQQKGKVYRWLHNINRRVFGGMKCLRLTNSEESAAFMYGKKRQAALVYNAIEIDRFRFDATVRDAVRTELQVGGRPVFGFSGRLCDPKNPLFLVDVFESIRRRIPEAVLLIAGEGELRCRIEERIAQKGLKDSVKLLGMRSDMERIYQAMDCFILPSRFEGLGIVLIEAQCAGVPCVTSADVVPQLAKVTELVEFVPLDDGAQAWADVCIRMLQNAAADRAQYAQVVGNSHFNILTEARRLEERLLDSAKNYGKKPR